MALQALQVAGPQWTVAARRLAKQMGGAQDVVSCPTSKLPSGELSHFAMERSTIFNGKIHYLTMAIFNCYVSSPEAIQWVGSDLEGHPIAKIHCCLLQAGFGPCSAALKNH